MNNMFNIINVTFICFGNLKIPLTLSFHGTFVKKSASLQKDMLLTFLSIFNNIYPISVNICQYTILRTVPAIRYCVRYLAIAEGPGGDQPGL